jgi:ABC-type Fe3+/spermidine/putrescine transport system ATPase subunit
MLRREIRSLLKEINVPSIFITHDQEEALELGDRIAVLNSGVLEQIGTPYEVYSRPDTEHVATFLGAANLMEGNVHNGFFAAGKIALELDEPDRFREGQPVTIVFRPEDVFLRRPENLTQHYRRMAEGTVEEMNFIGAFERVVVRLDVPDAKPIMITRPKTETRAFPLHVGQKVTAGLVRYRVLAANGKR